MERPPKIQKRQLGEAHAALRKWASLWDRQLDEASAALRKWESLWGPLFGPAQRRQLHEAHAALRTWESLWKSLWVRAAGHRQPVDGLNEPPGRKTDDSEGRIRDLPNTSDPPE